MTVKNKVKKCINSIMLLILLIVSSVCFVAASATENEKTDINNTELKLKNTYTETKQGDQFVQSNHTLELTTTSNENITIHNENDEYGPLSVQTPITRTDLSNIVYLSDKAYVLDEQNNKFNLKQFRELSSPSTSLNENESAERYIEITYELIKADNTATYTPNTPVYVTKSEKRYHLDKECAGDAIETTLIKVIKGDVKQSNGELFTPCQTCSKELTVSILRDIEAEYDASNNTQKSAETDDNNVNKSTEETNNNEDVEEEIDETVDEDANRETTEKTTTDSTREEKIKNNVGHSPQTSDTVDLLLYVYLIILSLSVITIVYKKS